MTAFIYKEDVLIGKCVHAICSCAAHFHDPEGCVNFIPHPKEDPMPMTTAAKIERAIDEWLSSNVPPVWAPTNISARKELATQLAAIVLAGQVGEASGMSARAEAPAEAPERYTVIAMDAMSRNWVDTREEATASAAKIFEKNGRENRTTKVMIVKAVGVAEKLPPPPPPVSVREPVLGDFPHSKSFSKRPYSGTGFDDEEA